MRRRTFLHTASILSLSGYLTKPVWAVSTRSKFVDSIGLQLWTVRNQLRDDPKKTLQAIADAGYRQVELMDIIGSESIQQMAKDCGLEIRSSFMNWEVIGKKGHPNVMEFEKVLDAAKKAGLKHLVFGYIGKGSREKVEQYQKMAADANRAGELCKQAGIQLCYHNHSFEFEKLGGGSTGFEVFMKEFDKDLMKFEVDVFWVKIGGWDPIDTMKKLGGRVSQVHLKDLKSGIDTIYDEGKVPADAFQELGDGTIDMSAVLKLAEEIGAQECHVEQDQSDDPIASIRQSRKHLDR